MKKRRTGTSITFRGKAARRAFEAITGTKLPASTPKVEPVAVRLTRHLAGGGTTNDSTTEALYREAKGIPVDQETRLEDVEAWAFDTARETITLARNLRPAPQPAKLDAMRYSDGQIHDSP